MFGFLYAIGLGIGGLIHGVKTSARDAELKEKWSELERNGENLGHIYMDSKGHFRTLRSGQIVIPTLKNGDSVIEDLHGNVLYNISQEKREKDFKEKVKENNGKERAIYYTVYDCKTTPIQSKSEVVTGTVYRDVYNNALYFKRIFYWTDDDMSYENAWGIKCDFLRKQKYSYCKVFYMDINTAKLVDVAETDSTKFNAPPDKCQEFIKYFNKAQDNGGWTPKDAWCPLECKYCTRFDY